VYVCRDVMCVSNANNANTGREENDEERGAYAVEGLGKLVELMTSRCVCVDGEAPNVNMFRVEHAVQAIEHCPRTRAAEGKGIQEQSNAEEPSYVRVACANGKVFRACQVFVCVGLGVLKAAHIVFSPPLPAWKARAIDNLGFQTSNSIVLRFSKCFWNEHDVQFAVAGGVDSPLGWFQNVNLHLPDTTSDAKSSSHHSHSNQRKLRANARGEYELAVFVHGHAATALEALSDQEWRRVCVSELQSAFPGTDVDSVCTGLRVSRWGSHPHIRGSESYCSTASASWNFKHIAHSLYAGRVRFAGEHTHRALHGTAEGAYSSALLQVGRMLERESFREKEQGRWDESEDSSSDEDEDSDWDSAEEDEGEQGEEGFDGLVL
jgi:hypothetical protein